jgi:hypothetical protein
MAQRTRRLWRLLHADDDLLSGFGREGGSRPPLRGFFAATVSLSLIAWNVMFSLGAYHTVFYWRLLDLLAVAIVLLLGVILLHREVRVRAWMVIVLAIPLVWVGVRVFTTAERPDSPLHWVDIVLTALTALTLPFILFALARIVAPDYFELPGRRLKVAMVGIVLVVSLIGYLIGAYNNLVLTCQDFNVAGDDLPANCHQVPAGQHG